MTNAAPATSFVPGVDGDVARIFNSTVAAFAIGAAWEVGALDELREAGTVDCSEFAVRHNLHLPSTEGMFAALAAVGIVHRHGSRVEQGAHFNEVFHAKAFFHWLTVGSVELFANMANVMRNDNRSGTFYRRNPVAIGFACRDINRQAFDPVFWQAMDELDVGFETVADLGCGSGERLVQIVNRKPGIRAIGLDISPAAVRDAEKYVLDLGLDDRIEFVEADACALAPDPRFADVELLTCFMMGHDFWPRDECVASLQRLRDAFPHVRRFLLGDTARTSGIPDTSMPVFNLAFEVGHDLMGAYLPTLQEWEGVFDESGWKCVNVRRVDVPVDSVIYELA